MAWLWRPRPSIPLSGPDGGTGQGPPLCLARICTRTSGTHQCSNERNPLDIHRLFVLRRPCRVTSQSRAEPPDFCVPYEAMAWDILHQTGIPFCPREEHVDHLGPVDVTFRLDKPSELWPPAKLVVIAHDPGHITGEVGVRTSTQDTTTVLERTACCPDIRGKPKPVRRWPASALRLAYRFC